MKKIMLALILAGSFCLLASAGVAKDAGGGKSRSELFEQHCAVCHPKGGNIVNPVLTLHKKALVAKGVKTAADIIGKMRNPGVGMTKFDRTIVPDQDAQKIADYVLKTFK